MMIRQSEPTPSERGCQAATSEKKKKKKARLSFKLSVFLDRVELGVMSMGKAERLLAPYDAT